MSFWAKIMAGVHNGDKTNLRNKPTRVDVGNDGTVNLTVLPENDPSIIALDEGGEYVQILRDNNEYTYFNIPSIFNTDNSSSPLCVSADNLYTCLGEIDPRKHGPLPELTLGVDPLSATLAGNDPKNPLPGGLKDFYTDYHLLYEVSQGRLKLSSSQEAYLRMHAASIVKRQRDFLVTEMPYVIDDTGVDPFRQLYGNDPSLQLLFGGSSATTPNIFYDADTLFGNDAFGSIFRGPDRGIMQGAIDQTSQEMYGYLLRDNDLSSVLQTELSYAKKNIRDILSHAAKKSYYDHSRAIAALEHIDDPNKLARAIDKINTRIAHGAKLAVLQAAADKVGPVATIGGRRINLTLQIAELSHVDIKDRKKYTKGVKKFFKNLELVSMANGLDNLIQVSKDLKKRAKDVKYTNDVDVDACAFSANSPEEVGVNIIGQSGVNTRLIKRKEYRAYFDGVISDAKRARALLDKGDVAGAKRAFARSFDQAEFNQKIKELQGDLNTTQRLSFAVSVLIIIWSAAIAAPIGAAAGAGVATTTGSSLLASLAAIGTEAGVFLASQKTMSWAMLDQNPFPKKTVSGNVFHIFEEWAMTALMFGFLKGGMGIYTKATRRMLVKRATEKLIAEGAITHAEALKATPEVVEKIMAKAELGLLGKVVNGIGLFAAEYGTFTVWDFLAQTYRASKEAGGLRLPQGFFTKKSFGERLLFLGCLKIGGILSMPITRPLQARAAAALMKRYSPKLESYNAEHQSLTDEFAQYHLTGKGGLAKLESIYSRMSGLLRKRLALEEALARMNPELASNVALTKNMLAEVGRMQRDAGVLKIINSGEYGKFQRKTLLKFLDDGKTKGLLTYRLGKGGRITVTFKNGEVKEIVTARRKTRELRGKLQPVMRLGSGLGGVGFRRVKPKTTVNGSVVKANGKTTFVNRASGTIANGAARGSSNGALGLLESAWRYVVDFISRIDTSVLGSGPVFRIRPGKDGKADPKQTPSEARRLQTPAPPVRRSQPRPMMQLPKPGKKPLAPLKPQPEPRIPQPVSDPIHTTRHGNVEFIWFNKFVENDGCLLRNRNPKGSDVIIIIREKNGFERRLGPGMERGVHPDAEVAVVRSGKRTPFFKASIMRKENSGKLPEFTVPYSESAPPVNARTTLHGMPQATPPPRTNVPEITPIDASKTDPMTVGYEGIITVEDASAHFKIEGITKTSAKVRMTSELSGNARYKIFSILSKALGGRAIDVVADTPVFRLGENFGNGVHSEGTITFEGREVSFHAKDNIRFKDRIVHVEIDITVEGRFINKKAVRDAIISLYQKVHGRAGVKVKLDRFEITYKGPNITILNKNTTSGDYGTLSWEDQQANVRLRRKSKDARGKDVYHFEVSGSFTDKTSVVEALRKSAGVGAVRVTWEVPKVEFSKNKISDLRKDKWTDGGTISFEGRTIKIKLRRNPDNSFDVAINGEFLNMGVAIEKFKKSAKNLGKLGHIHVLEGDLFTAGPISEYSFRHSFNELYRSMGGVNSLRKWHTPEGRATVLRTFVKAIRLVLRVRNGEKAKSESDRALQQLYQHPHFHDVLKQVYGEVLNDVYEGRTKWDAHFALIPEADRQRLEQILANQPGLNDKLTTFSKIEGQDIQGAGSSMMPNSDNRNTFYYDYHAAGGRVSNDSLFLRKSQLGRFSDEFAEHALNNREKYKDSANPGQCIIEGPYWIQDGHNAILGPDWSFVPRPRNGLKELEGRIYFAVKLKYAKEFWTALSNARHRDYKHLHLVFKQARDTKRYKSGDTAVLYFDAKDSKQVLALVRKLHRKHPEYFRDTQPVFAAKIRGNDGTWMRGISFAQSPTNGKSFNGLIAEITSAAKNGAFLHNYMRLLRGEKAPTAEQLLHQYNIAIAHALEKAGISLDHTAFLGGQGVFAFSPIYDHSNQSAKNRAR